MIRNYAKHDNIQTYRYKMIVYIDINTMRNAAQWKFSLEQPDCLQLPVLGAQGGIGGDDHIVLSE